MREKTNSLREPQSDAEGNLSNIIRTCLDVKKFCQANAQQDNSCVCPPKKKHPNPDRAGKEYIVSAWYEKTLPYYPNTKDKADSMAIKLIAMKTHAPHSRLCHGQKSGLRGSISKR